MKSIREKAEEYTSTIENQVSNNVAFLAYKSGGNYVLEKFVDIVNKNTKSNGMEDRAEMASDMLILIEQLKK